MTMNQNTIKHNAPTCSCTNISNILKLLNDLLLARSELLCHPIITRQKKSLHFVTQHNIFELALTSHDEDSRDSVGNSELQSIKLFRML